MSKKLNAVTLSGLMIGPILGSGIIFLPPLAYKNLGEHAIFAWIIIMLMGVLFAYVFSKMNAAARDNQGASMIIAETLGKRAGALSAELSHNGCSVWPNGRCPDRRRLYWHAVPEFRHKPDCCRGSHPGHSRSDCDFGYKLYGENFGLCYQPLQPVCCSGAAL